MEQFTAVALCPSCGWSDTHWIDQPQTQPDSVQIVTMGGESFPIVHNVYRLNIETQSLEYLGPDAPNPYDPPGATVARICRNCKHRWAQQ